MSDIVIDLNYKGGELSLSLKKVLNCCALLSIEQWYVSPDNYSVILSSPERYTVYDSLMKKMVTHLNNYYVMTADPSEESEYSAGYTNSQVAQGLSLREFCEYHNFRMLREHYKNCETIIEIYGGNFIKTDLNYKSGPIFSVTNKGKDV